MITCVIGGMTVWITCAIAGRIAVNGGRMAGTICKIDGTKGWIICVIAGRIGVNDDRMAGII